MSRLIDAISNSSSKSILEATIRLRTENRFKADRWISKWNRYSKDVIKQLEIDETNSKVKRNKNQLAEYISASSMIHCHDGWNFFIKFN